VGGGASGVPGRRITPWIGQTAGMSWSTMAPRQPDWIDTAPIRIESTRVIAAEPDLVWAVIADHRSWTEWFAGVRRVEVTGAAEGVGGQRRVTISGGLRFDEVFTAWEPGSHFAFTVGGMRPPLMVSMAESVRLEPVEDGTSVSYRQGWEPRRAVDWLWRRSRARIQTSLDAALDGLAGRVETVSG
jgi:uncharacterized protein YndB with AHSA1/START domain